MFKLKEAFVSAQLIANHDLPYLFAAAKDIPGVVIEVETWGGSKNKRTVVDSNTGEVEIEEIIVPDDQSYATVRFISSTQRLPFWDRVDMYREIDKQPPHYAQNVKPSGLLE